MGLVIYPVRHNRRCCDKGPRCASWRVAPLIHQPDLDGLQTLCQTLRARRFAVFRPIQPAVGFRVYPVINIIFLSEIIGQFNLDRFQAFGLSCRSAVFSVINPILPAITLYMGAIANTALSAINVDADGFKPFGLSCRSADRAQAYVILPAIGLHMGLIRQNALFVLNKGAAGQSRGAAALFHNTDLQGFHLLAAIDSSRGLAVFRPIQPAVGFRMNTVINIKLLRRLSCQFQPNGLNGLAVSRISI